MNLLFNCFLYILITFLIFQNHLPLAVIAAAVFTWRAGAVWLLPLAICIDGYFGAFYEVPIVSLVAGIWFLITELISPQLLLKKRI
jgi:hypothetical protein